MAGGDENNTVKPNDPQSVYYLSTSDHLGYIISPISLDGENYGNWSRLVINALKSKNKIGFVDGTLTKPASTSAEAHAWEKCNSMVIAWISNVIDKSLHGSITYAATARDIWVDLVERYSQGNAIRIHQLRRDINLMSQGDMSVTTYFTKLKTLWDELHAYLTILACTCGAGKFFQKQLEDEKVHQFLMGLDAKAYGPTRSQILSIEPLPNLNKVYASLIKEERQRSLTFEIEGKSMVEAAALHVGAPSGRSRSESSRPKCSHCRKLGHEKHQCFELIGYPPNWGSRRSNRSGGNNGGRGGSKSWSGPAHSQTWMPPSSAASGAANHAHIGDNAPNQQSSINGDQFKSEGTSQFAGLSSAQVEELFALFKEKQSQEITGPHLKEADWGR